jgi:hypothetical protein
VCACVRGERGALRRAFFLTRARLRVAARPAPPPQKPSPCRRSHHHQNNPPKQTFDAGLLGEGALHIASAIHSRGLLASSPSAAVVPRGAVLFAQPGRLQRLLLQSSPPAGSTSTTTSTAQHLLGLGGDGANRALDEAADPYTWRRGQYEALDLEALAGAGAWRPASAPQPAFRFAFDDPEAASGGLVAADEPGEEERVLEFGAAQEEEEEDEEEEEVNAVAFFFALDMGGGELLLSSARAGAVAEAEAAGGSGRATAVASSWKQAVQRLPARKVKPGQPIRVRAKHDTYGATFEWVQEEEQDEDAQGAARDDELDRAVLAAERGLAAPLARAVAQDPLAYRELATAAAALAASSEEGQSAVGGVAARFWG